MACTGDAQELCGGPNRLNLFFSGGSPPPPPITVPSVGLWESLGCFTYACPQTFKTAKQLMLMTLS